MAGTVGIGAASGAGALEVTFIAVYLHPVPPFGPTVLGHAHWGMLAFAAAFVAIGVVMVAVIRRCRVADLAAVR